MIPATRSEPLVGRHELPNRWRLLRVEEIPGGVLEERSVAKLDIHVKRPIPEPGGADTELSPDRHTKTSGLVVVVGVVVVVVIVVVVVVVGVVVVVVVVIVIVVVLVLVILVVVVVDVVVVVVGTSTQKRY